MIRKIWIMLLAAALGLSLTACGGQEAPVTTPPPPKILELPGEFQTNIKDEDRAYVLCTVSLEAGTDEDLLIITDNVSKVRDIINKILRSKTLEELKHTDAQQNLSAEIAEQVRSTFDIHELKGVYFESYYTSP